jgi:molybdenum cofactor synthesis domain-containing protein
MYDQAPEISNIKLLFKKGGKKGLWTNPTGVPKFIEEFLKQQIVLQNIKSAVVTLSDRASAKIYDDESGKIISEILTKNGAEIVDYKIIPDEESLITETIKKICDEKNPQLIITTGGTGISSRDNTPEAIKKLTSRTIPGIGELLRINGAKFTKHSWSSRSLAAIYQKTLIITLPGSPKAVRESMDCLLPLLPHLISGKHD